MKVKLKKPKKSPAPIVAEQVKIKSTIEMLRKSHAYGVPIRVIYDRGYQQIIDLADRIQKTNKKVSAPVATKQMLVVKPIEANIKLSRTIENVCDINKKDFLLNDTDLLFAKTVHQRLQTLRNTIHR